MGRTCTAGRVRGLALDADPTPSLRPLQAPPQRPGLFFATVFTLDQPGDLHLDMRDWRKGYLWVNGRLLGRYWDIGPQQCLYCPGAWLRAGANQVLILDLHRLQPGLLRCANGLIPTPATQASAPLPSPQDRACT